MPASEQHHHYDPTTTLFLKIENALDVFSDIVFQDSYLHIKQLRATLKVRLGAKNTSGSEWDFRVIYFQQKQEILCFSYSDWHHVVTFKTKGKGMFCRCVFTELAQ